MTNISNEFPASFSPSRRLRSWAFATMAAVGTSMMVYSTFKAVDLFQPTGTLASKILPEILYLGISTGAGVTASYGIASIAKIPAKDRPEIFRPEFYRPALKFLTAVNAVVPTVVKVVVSVFTAVGLATTGALIGTAIKLEPPLSQYFHNGLSPDKWSAQMIVPFALLGVAAVTVGATTCMVYETRKLRGLNRPIRKSPPGQASTL